MSAAVTAKVHFPLVDCDLEVDIQPALTRLSGPRLHDITSCRGDVEDSDLVHHLLKLLDDAVLADAYQGYKAEYRRLSLELANHRGYGLEGDEPPTLVVDARQLLAWLAAEKPALLNQIAVDYYGPDIRVTREGRRWQWSTVRRPKYALPTKLAGRKSARSFSSLRQAQADAVASLSLAPTFEAHLTGAVKG